MEWNALIDRLIAKAKQKKYKPLPEYMFIRLIDSISINDITLPERKHFVKVDKYFNVKDYSRRSLSKFQAQIVNNKPEEENSIVKETY